MKFKVLIMTSLFLIGQHVFSQSGILISEEKEKGFTPYLYPIHGGPEGVELFKKEHKYEYLKELWYYSESFYVKRDVFKEGQALDPYWIDISRFEKKRLDDQESEVVLGGFKDVLVLLPRNKLIYYPATK